MSYQVICHVNSLDVEALSEFFFLHHCLGTEIKENINNMKDHFGEIYQNDEESIQGSILIGYFENVNEFLPLLNHYIFQKNIYLYGNIEIKYMDDEKFYNSYQSYYTEISITDKISIIPSWFEETAEDKLYIKIEPGLGFGTGSHPTTQLAIKHLLKYLHNKNMVLDLGTGSGILAILTSKLGVETIDAIDLDEQALKNARYNAAINEVHDIHFSQASIDQLNNRYHLIVANITFNILVDLLLPITNHLYHHGIVIFSGILNSQKQMMMDHLNQFPYEIIEVNESGEWISIVAKKNC